MERACSCPTNALGMTMLAPLFLICVLYTGILFALTIINVWPVVRAGCAHMSPRWRRERRWRAQRVHLV
jgi:hypothetical protein